MQCSSDTSSVSTKLVSVRDLRRSCDAPSSEDKGFSTAGTAYKDFIRCGTVWLETSGRRSRLYQDISGAVSGARDQKQNFQVVYQVSRAESVLRGGFLHSFMTGHSHEAMLAYRCVIATGIHGAATVRANLRSDVVFINRRVKMATKHGGPHGSGDARGKCRMSVQEGSGTGSAEGA